jgi:capsular polysaccharide biosynthesis protein
MPQFHPAFPKLVTRSEPGFEIQDDAIATTFVLQGLAFSGAIHDRQGALVRRSLRACGPTEKVYSTDPEILAEPPPAEMVPGVGYYIGNIMSHYGHFITEGLSSLWLSDTVAFDYYVAHPFIWGAEIPAFARQAFARLGVDPDRIRLVEQPTRFERLIVPDRLWLMNASVNAAYRRTVSALKGHYLRPQPHLKLYLSRAEIPKRAVPNERAIEEVFRRAGFVVIQPQNHGFGAQLELFGQAAMIAGLAGSALHNVIFCPRGTATISIGDRRGSLTRNQLICGAFVHGTTAVIPYAEGPGGFDIATLEAELARILETWGG